MKPNNIVSLTENHQLPNGGEEWMFTRNGMLQTTCTTLRNLLMESPTRFDWILSPRISTFLIVHSKSYNLKTLNYASATKTQTFLPCKLRLQNASSTIWTGSENFWVLSFINISPFWRSRSISSRHIKIFCLQNVNLFTENCKTLRTWFVDEGWKSHDPLSPKISPDLPLRMLVGLHCLGNCTVF